LKTTSNWKAFSQIINWAYFLENLNNLCKRLQLFI